MFGSIALMVRSRSTLIRAGCPAASGRESEPVRIRAERRRLGVFMGRRKWGALILTRWGREGAAHGRVAPSSKKSLPRLEEAVDVEPVREGLEPPVGGVARIAHAEAVTAI